MYPKMLSDTSCSGVMLISFNNFFWFWLEPNLLRKISTFPCLMIYILYIFESPRLSVGEINFF